MPHLEPLIMKSSEMGLKVYQEHNFFTPLSSNSFFFHSSDFVHSSEALTNSCWKLETTGKNIIARICFTTQEDTAVSLLKSSFGSFELVQGIKKEQLSFFVDQLLIKLKALNYKALRIISFPRAYNPLQFDLIHEVLDESGFETVEQHANHYLFIDQHNRLADLVKADERRYLNRGKKMGFDFRQLDIQYLPLAYDLIRSCRLKKGYSISMTYQELRHAILRFPDHYFIFGLFYDDRMLASSVCIKINKSILYDFYHGDDLNFRKYSPVVPLLEGIYRYAQTNNYQILDLGTSVEEGVYDFKKNMGAMVSEKVVLEKTI